MITGAACCRATNEPPISDAVPDSENAAGPFSTRAVFCAVIGMFLAVPGVPDMRRVLFGTLEDGLGSTAAMWLQSLVFAAMHLSNAPASNMELATTMVAGTLIGAFRLSDFKAALRRKKA
mgnify:CR=1 FL=1